MSRIGASEQWQYSYNADGLRTQRTNGTTTYQYTYLGGQLTHMTVAGDTMYFAYDAAGVPMTLTYNGVTYYYVTNLQGDVVSILDKMGTEVVHYTYDAWGNLLSTTGAMADTLGYYNPLRYRGYVYDPEIELYYLQSRYYNPEMGRFINADGLVSTGQGLLGNNTFAYCLNNPVNFVDRDGKSAEPVTWAATMWWLCGVDGPIPIGEAVYGLGFVVLAVDFVLNDDYLPEATFDEVYTDYGPPSPNGDDDDDLDDDYYDDDSNFGGRERMGKSKGKTPRNNQAQNKQFKDATKGLPKDVQQKIHTEITGQGNGYHEIVEIAKKYFPIGFGTFGMLGYDEWEEKWGL